MRVMLALFFVIFIATAFPPLSFTAETTSSTDEIPKSSQGDDIPLLGESLEKSLDETQQLYSDRLRQVAVWIDSFFDNRRFRAEDNKTRATLKLGFEQSEEDDFKFVPRVNLRLDLPGLQGETQLLLTGGSDEDFGDTDNPLLGNDPNSSEVAAGIRQFFIQTDDINLSSQVGVKKDEFFAGVRFRALKNIGNWNARFTNRLQYYTDDKFENHTALDFEAIWGDKWMFRSSTGVLLSEREDGVPYGQWLKFYQVLNEYRIISYEGAAYLVGLEKSHFQSVSNMISDIDSLSIDGLFSSRVIRKQKKITFPSAS